MKLLFILPLIQLVLGVSLEKRAKPKGIDVSRFQPNVDWNKAKANGVSFAFIKATEGTTVRNPIFSEQYSGATNGIAHPDSSSGAAQANFFLAHGGGWSGDGITLPGVLDIEFNPKPGASTCYGLSAAAMVAWIKDFSDTYRAKTSRYPIIYTNTNWWKQCTGNSAVFGSTNPLWIARYSSSPGALPAGWPTHTFWQFADHGANPGDQNEFNGDLTALKRIASG